jgi:uncharacterized protein
VQVRFDEIPAEGREFDIKDASWFPAGEVRAAGPARARILLERRDGEGVFLQGTLAGQVRLTCDRCLAEYDFTLDHEFRIDLELVDQDAAPVAEAEHACQDSEMDVMFLTEPLIDLGEILAQQVFLTLPAKRLCSETCQGLCPRCGINRNQDRCDCGDSSGSSPFAVLRTLKH